jgi:hypothetical protein
MNRRVANKFGRVTSQRGSRTYSRTRTPTCPRKLSLAAASTRNCLTIGTKLWRRERDSNRIQTLSRISKLRIQKTIWSPGIPRNPHSCHWSCHWKSLSRADFAAPPPDGRLGRPGSNGQQLELAQRGATQRSIAPKRAWLRKLAISRRIVGENKVTILDGHVTAITACESGLVHGLAVVKLGETPASCCGVLG